MTPRNPQTATPLRTPTPRPYSAPYTPSGPLMTMASSSHGGAFAIGVVITFFLFSHASEFIDTSGRLHMVQVLGALGLLALIAAGSIPRTLATPPGIWLTLFTGWLVLSMPFSSWKGQSFREFTGMWLKSYLAFFLVAGLIFTLEQCRKSIFWLAFSTVAVIYYAFRAGINSAEDNRFSVTYGSLGNSNDLASALLMGVPFLLYVAMDKRRNAIARVAAALFTLVLLLVVFRTGSRGALFGIAAMVGITFIKTNAANKFKIVALCGVLALCFPLVVSRSMIARYATIMTSKGGGGNSAEVASAVESTNARRELMKQGVLLTLHHPVFGVGLGNFQHQSANLFMSRGETPLWFTCHDIFLLVSSETGVPGFIMFMAVIVMCYKSLLGMMKKSRGVPELEEAGNMAFCIMVSLTAYLACGVFSTSAYSVQLPLVAGLTAALERASKTLMANAGNTQPPQFAAPYLPRPAVPRFAPARLAAPRLATFRS
jgi:O-antigen ligase